MADEKDKARKVAATTIKLAAALRATIPMDDKKLLRSQCDVWSDLANDLSWISDRKPSRNLPLQNTLGDFRANEYWTFLERAYQNLGLGPEQALNNVRELRRNFNAVEVYGPVLVRPPMDRLAVAASVGAVRGQVCTLADLFSDQPSDGLVSQRSRKVLVKVSLALPTILLFMASTNANEIPANIESFGHEVVRVAEWGLEEAAKPRAQLDRRLAQELSLNGTYLAAALGPQTIIRERDAGMSL